MRHTTGGPAVQITAGRLALLAGCLALLAGCTGHGAGGVSTGAISGSLLRVGGPAPGAAVPLAGHVVATNPAGTRFTAGVGGSGRYRLTLPPGSYRVTGHSPMVYVNGKPELCAAARPANVTADKTTSGVNVICSIS